MKGHNDELTRAVRGQASRFYDIKPVPAPRQSERDKWKPSKAVLEYRAFRDAVGWRKVELPEDFFHVVFLIECPRSWSQYKKTKMIGHPHKSGDQPDGSFVKECKPDADNLAKALIDAVFRNVDDSHVWNYTTTKLWAGASGIVISETWIPFWELPVDLSALVDGTLHTVDFAPDV